MKLLSAAADYTLVLVMSTLAGAVVAVIVLGALIAAAGGEPVGSTQWLPASGILGLAYGLYAVGEHRETRRQNHNQP